VRVAVIGAPGQVGSEIVLAARAAGLETIPLTHADCDVTDRASLDAAFRDLGDGDFVANTAAFHRTDACEDDPERAMAVNALGAFNAAAAANERGAGIVFVSSDFVFDGSKDSAYVESDSPRPINAYGVSKFAGEMLAAHANPSHYVVRISSVFGVAGASGKGGNFVETIISKARSGAPIEVVDDIVMAPTYAADAAQLLVALVSSRAPFGLYHLANAGECSWLELAAAILADSGSEARPRPISSADVVGKARRPRRSTLASEKLAPLGLGARPWREALDDYLVEKGYRPM
jgi:dTDP-4-dehydrorhamnose reductase